MLRTRTSEKLATQRADRQLVRWATNVFLYGSLPLISLLNKRFFLLQCLSDLDAIHVECVDITSTAGDCDGLAKLQLAVASPKFDALRLMQRHQLVNDCVLGEFMPQIHAISITTYTTAQHERWQQQEQHEQQQHQEQQQQQEQQEKKEGGAEADAAAYGVAAGTATPALDS